VPTYLTPGVFVEEIVTLPPSIAEVATAVPAFIGYTQNGPATGAPLVVRVATMLEFQTAFGGPPTVPFNVTLAVDGQGNPAAAPVVALSGSPTPFSLYYALSHYFRNGGGPCYVISVGNYQATAAKSRFADGLEALAHEDEPTLIVLTDAACVLPAADYRELCGEALAQCAALGDRFAILDVPGGDYTAFRNDSNLSSNLMYGAAYLPYLQTTLNIAYDESNVTVVTLDAANPPTPTASGTTALGDANGLTVSYSGPAASTPGVSVAIVSSTTKPTFDTSDGNLTITVPSATAGTDVMTAWTAWTQNSAAKPRGYSLAAKGTGATAIGATPLTAITLGQATTPPAAGVALASDAIKGQKTAVYNKAKAALDAQRLTLPPSAAVAGIYARVDREQGVWKAPANVGLLSVLGPVSKINDDDQNRLNVDSTAGKSINAIRAFVGKGTLVWGARTLAGNDNEWRYVSVRRLFITIEESTKKASAFAVFEPNDQSTWLKVKAMIESYLYGLWEQGALQGAKPEDAYFVHVGLGTTMTPQDLLEGRMIVAVGVAAVRPAEFIVIRFSHKLQTA
jgi:Phage tail sheath protein FI